MKKFLITLVILLLIGIATFLFVANASYWVPIQIPSQKKILHSVEDTRNLQRRSDVNSILNAVYQYAVDHGGSLPASIPDGAPTEICSAVSSQCANLVDLSVLVPTYLASIPKDPTYKGSNGTQYLISTLKVETKTVVKVTAANAENGVDISVQR